MIPKQKIKEYLLQALDGAATVSGGTEIAAPCPVCGERRRKLYIGPFDDSDDPIRYNCFICKAHGFVDERFLDACKIDINTDSEIIKSNRGPGYAMRFMKRDNNDFNSAIDHSYITPGQLSDFKLDYINKRLGLQLSYKDCIDNKIVLNILDIYKSNVFLDYFTRPDQAMQQLNSYFIGFMTRSSSEINMRNLAFNKPDIVNKFHESMRCKYINYKIFRNVSVENDFYVLPCNIDPSRPVNVYIAEGPMDVLGIKYNLIKSIDNCLYVAGKGKAYDNAILWSIKSLAMPALNIHLFPDRDVSNSYIRGLILKYKTVFTNYRFFIHNNQYGHEKDYGVPEWKISDFMWEEKINNNIV